MNDGLVEVGFKDGLNKRKGITLLLNLSTGCLRNLVKFRKYPSAPHASFHELVPLHHELPALR